MYSLTVRTRLSSYIHGGWGIWISSLFALSWLDKLIVPVPYVGDLAIGLCGLSLGGYALLRIIKQQSIPRVLLQVGLAFAALILIYLAGNFVNYLPNLKPILQLLLISLYFIGAAFVLCRESNIEVIANLWIFFSWMNLAVWVIRGFDYPFQSILSHKNLLGALTAFGLFFIWAARQAAANKRWWTVGVITSLVVLLASGSRGAWLTILAVIGIYWLWPKISAKKSSYHWFIVILFVGLLGAIFLYVELTQLKIYPQMAAFFLKYTGQNLYSGRQAFWPLLIEAIQRRPWGYGPGASPDYFVPLGLSSHNLYLQVAIQTGLPGLFFLGLIFFLIWSNLYRTREEPLARLTGAYLIGALVFELFEVTLIQNNLTVGIVVWSILAVGIGNIFLAPAQYAEPV